MDLQWLVIWSDYDDYRILGRFDNEAEATAFSRTLRPTDGYDDEGPSIRVEQEKAPLIPGPSAKWGLTVSFLDTVGHWVTWEGLECPIDEESSYSLTDDPTHVMYSASVYAATFKEATDKFEAIHGIAFSEDHPLPVVPT